MSLKKQLNHLPKEQLAANGLFKHDWEALTPCQRECTDRLARTIEIKQEAFLTKHPEVLAILKMYVTTAVKNYFSSAKEILNTIDSAKYFTRPKEELIGEINEFLGLEGPPFLKDETQELIYEDLNLIQDLKDIIKKHYPPPPWEIEEKEVETPYTVSSSFVSKETSSSTLATPEPEPIPEPTMAELIYGSVSYTVDKAIFSNVNDHMLRYDFAYVELQKLVEHAMEIPVVHIREDIAVMFSKAYRTFELIVIDRSQRAMEAAWDNRMRKKFKHSFRLQSNFRGNPTPSEFESDPSSHESYRIPPPGPCQCFPKIRFNRYPKDRFGVYLPSEKKVAITNIMVTPVLSETDLTT